MKTTSPWHHNNLETRVTHTNIFGDWIAEVNTLKKKNDDVTCTISKTNVSCPSTTYTVTHFSIVSTGQSDHEGRTGYPRCMHSTQV
jgi:hypothetical protein